LPFEVTGIGFQTPLAKSVALFELALHLQHAHDCKPCPSVHARLPPVLLVVRRSHVQCTTLHDPTLPNRIDSSAATAYKQTVNVTE